MIGFPVFFLTALFGSKDSTEKSQRQKCVFLRQKSKTNIIEARTLMTRKKKRDESCKLEAFNL